MRSLYIKVAICLLAVAVRADPTSNPTKSPAQSKIDLLELAATMAESSFSLKPTLANRAGLIVTYEKLVTAYCMPNILNTLEYKPSDREPESKCSEMIEKTLNMHEQSPVAICAAEGFQSPNCSEAYSRQGVITFANAEIHTYDVELKLHESKMKKELDDLSQELSRAKESDRSKEEKLSILGRLIEINCKIWSIELEAIEERLPTPSPTPRDVSIFDTPLNITPVASEQSLKLRRRRLLSTNCLRNIQEALALDKQFAPAICARDGISPACLEARREAKRQKFYKLQETLKNTPKNKSSTRAPAFETF